MYSHFPPVNNNSNNNNKYLYSAFLKSASIFVSNVPIALASVFFQENHK